MGVYIFQANSTDTEIPYLREQVEFFRRENSRLRKNIITYRNRIVQLDKVINNIRDDQQEESRVKRENDVVMHGIPFNGTIEPPTQFLEVLSKAFEYPLTHTNVYSISRLRSRDMSNMPVLLKFYEYDEKDKFLQHAEQKPIFASQFGGPRWKKIFVNEHLTKKAADLFRLCLKLRDTGLAKVWTKRGRVYLKRRALGAKSMEIFDKSQIDMVKKVTGSIERSKELDHIRESYKTNNPAI